MGDRAVYCARLESVCAERHPGFESPPIRHTLKLASLMRKVKVKLKVFSGGPAEDRVGFEPRRLRSWNLRDSAISSQFRDNFELRTFLGITLTVADGKFEMAKAGWP